MKMLRIQRIHPVNTGRTLAALGLVAALGAQRLAAQAFYPREPIAVLRGWIDGEIPQGDISNQQTYKNPAWCARLLEQFPAADANGDGTVTEQEASSFQMGRVRVMSIQGQELAELPSGVSRWTDHVSMRDGKTLPTEIYLPPGQGPWPVVLMRTTRGRVDSALDYGNEILRSGFAFVGQDLTPEGDFINADELGHEVAGSEMTREERAAYNARRSQRDFGNDGFDTLDWLAHQPWCNGEIGQTGYSEGSAQTKSALSENPPALHLTVTAIGTLSAADRGPIAVASGGQVDYAGEFPAVPTSWKPEENLRRWENTGRLLAAAAKVTGKIYRDRTGWFDFSVQGAIDEWKALKTHNLATLIMGISGHGAISPAARQAPAYGDSAILFPEIEDFEMLRGRTPPKKSLFFYFLMGDATNPAAPGNVWKVTDTWPLPHTTQHWYLHFDDNLAASEPPAKSGVRTYTYDPNNPIRMTGGARMPGRRNGPLDFRVAEDRADILRFDSAPLASPLEVTGEASFDLYFSSDAPDTCFVVTILDIYPDGYEWPIRDTAVTTRYMRGDDHPIKLEQGHVYHVNLALVSTALMLDKGHRIGVRITSSSFPAYTIHPNTWTAIDSYDQARVAHQQIYTGGEHASRLNLPVLAPGTSTNYDPRTVY